MKKHRALRVGFLAVLVTMIASTLLLGATTTASMSAAIGDWEGNIDVRGSPMREVAADDFALCGSQNQQGESHLLFRKRQNALPVHKILIMMIRRWTRPRYCARYEGFPQSVIAVTHRCDGGRSRGLTRAPIMSPTAQTYPGMKSTQILSPRRRTDGYTWNEIPDQQSAALSVPNRSYFGFAVWRAESAQSVGGSKLCTADRLGMQRLSLCSSGTQPCRTKVQVARLR